MDLGEPAEPTDDEVRFGQALILLALAWTTSRCIGAPGVEEDSWHVYCVPDRWRRPLGERQVLGHATWADESVRRVEISAWTVIQLADSLAPPLAHAYIENTEIDPDVDKQPVVSHRLVVPVDFGDHPSWAQLAGRIAALDDATWNKLVEGAHQGLSPEEIADSVP